MGKSPSLVRGWIEGWDSPCLRCRSGGPLCHNDAKVVLFPCEGHLVGKFPCKRFTSKGVELYYFKASECPYFTPDGQCRVYGSGYLPIDCRIYPLVLGGLYSFKVDVKCEMWAEFVSDPIFLLECRELVSSCKVTRSWVKAYLEV